MNSENELDLKSNLDNKRHDEVLKIVNEFTNLDPKTHIHNEYNLIGITKQGIEDFITLLNPTEYVSDYAEDIQENGDKKVKAENHYYYLTFWPNIIVELFIEDIKYFDNEEEVSRNTRVHYMLYNNKQMSNSLDMISLEELTTRCNNRFKQEEKSLELK